MDDLILPDPALRPYIEGYWQRQGDFPNERRVRVLADACTKIIFELAPGPWPPAYVIATQLVPIVVTLRGRTNRVGIRFRPGMAGFFLGRPLDGLDRPFAALSAIGVEYEQLESRLRATGDLSERGMALDNWLHCLKAAVEADQIEIEETTRLVAGLRQGRPPKELAAAMGWSERRLQRFFRTRFGASAANLHRFYRFECLQARLAGSPTELADLAAELGFADQSHMARDFRHFAGCTISSYLREMANVGNVQDAGGWLRVLRRAEESG